MKTFYQLNKLMFSEHFEESFYNLKRKSKISNKIIKLKHYCSIKQTSIQNLKFSEDLISILISSRQ